MVNTFALFDWMNLSEVYQYQHHKQVLLSTGADRDECPVAIVGGHDICGWGTPMQLFRAVVMYNHLLFALVLVIALPYQVFVSKKGGPMHKKIGYYTTVVLVVQAIGGITSLTLQAVRQFIVMPRDDLPPEMGYVLPLSSKFVFLPMFALGFVTPILNGLGKWVLKIPYSVCAVVTFVTLLYDTLYAYPVMIRRLFNYSYDTYEFQMLLELIVISALYPLQDFGNLLKYYDHFVKGKKMDDLAHHINNARILTAVAFTAVTWFSVHYRPTDENGDQWTVPTFYRIFATLLPCVFMAFTGSLAEFLEYLYGGLFVKDKKE